ncbi:phospholipase D-like domain-containing protein [Rothia nasimurium]|uniref:phospholipase D-like domain-containing protein n=1 Tax=Rothia nasimurium TaxID=85336 RepID=UPI002DD63F08|nr:phospholipase D-like domain-containing protein [Rothia nasimurium]
MSPRPLAGAALACGAVAAASALYYCYKPLPAGLGLTGPWRSGQVELLADLTYRAGGKSQTDQQIFRAIEGVIERAESFLILDMFLFNSDYDRSGGRIYPALSQRLTDALLTKRAVAPELPIVLITDPINTFYGSYPLPHLERLQAAGVQVVETRLEALRDSNPVYSGFYRAFLAHLPELPTVLPNALAPGGPRVSANAYARLFNFKANHRKVALSEAEAVVASANPHDASAPNSNLGVRVTGAVVGDLLASELAVLDFSAPDLARSLRGLRFAGGVECPGQASEVQLVTEGGIRDAALELLAGADAGDRVCLGMFYLSERAVIAELKAAAARGASVQVVLDLNIDAFGRTKTGLPALPVARELVRAGVQVRWYATDGEQFHPKYLAVYRGQDAPAPADSGSFELLSGSGNFTRRNLCNYNLETSLRVRAAGDSALAREFSAYWSLIWNNEPVDGAQTTFTLPYAAKVGGSILTSTLQTLAYRAQEATGLSTF